MLQVYGGLHREYPAGTMPAFVGAVCQGYDAVRVDVHLTKDGKAVVLGDSLLDKTARREDGTASETSVRIGDISYEEALQYEFGGWFSNKYRGEKIVLLSELLELAEREHISVTVNSHTPQVYAAAEKTAAEVAFVCHSTQEAAEVSERLPKAGVSYRGPVSNAILQELSCRVEKKCLTVWQPDTITRAEADRIKQYGALGILNIGSYAQYDSVMDALAPDAVETDGTVKPVRRMGFLADTHVHSEFSHDSDSKLPDICDAAAEKGIAAVCITDHCDVHPRSDLEQMAQVRRDVCEAVRRTREQTDAAELLVGIELGCGAFYPEGEIFSETARRILRADHCDAVIGSVHSVQFMSTARNDYSSMSQEELIQCVVRYLNAIESMLEHGQPDILGHMTYPLRYINGKYGRNLDWKLFKPQIERILQCLIRRGIALELNTSCRGTNYDELLPNDQIIQMYLQMGGYLMTLGSDAHVPNRLGMAFADTIARLKAMGVRNLYYLKDRYFYQYSI